MSCLRNRLFMFLVYSIILAKSISHYYLISSLYFCYIAQFMPVFSVFMRNRFFILCNRFHFFALRLRRLTTMQHMKNQTSQYSGYLTKSSKSPPIAYCFSQLKQWVVTCLYQEECKLFLINCGAIIWCRAT